MSFERVFLRRGYLNIHIHVYTYNVIESKKNHSRRRTRVNSALLRGRHTHMCIVSDVLRT